MDTIRHLVTRNESAAPEFTTASSVTNLLLALLTLVFFALALVGVLYILRRRQGATKQLLPTHEKNSNYRRLTITATPYAGKTDSIHVYDEKRNLIENSCGPPDSPVPEIRITFPDEEDPYGQRMTGKVVVVRIGDSGSVGMEPVSPDRLPPYQSSESERFQSLDLERIGGLKEKPESRRWT